MAKDEDVAGTPSQAERLFAGYVQRNQQGAEEDIETLCRVHPDLAAELRQLHQQWRDAGSTRGELFFDGEATSRRLRTKYEKATDPEISLDPDSPESSAPSEVVLQRLAQHSPPVPRYTLRGEVAKGGMGAILKVWDEDLRRNLAMKVILGQAGAETPADTPEVDEATLNRFLEEAQITGQLDHPGVVPVHELGLDWEGRVYFTMRLVKGRDFRKIIDAVHKGEEGWSLTRALGVLLKSCEAMAYAHAKGVIHRDLKPANIMVGSFGEVYVMDWGLARLMGRPDTRDIRPKPVDMTSLVETDRREEAHASPDSPLLTMDGDIIGTPAYMSPEQARGALDKIGPHTDVYCLGAILYHLLAGHMPYVKPGAAASPYMVLRWVLEGAPPPLQKLRAGVPAELVAICEKAMDPAIGRRYADTQELAEDLRAYLENRVVRAHRTGALIELRKWVVRNKAAALGIAACLVLAAAGLGAVAYVQRTARSAIARKNVSLSRALRRTRALALASASAAESEDSMRALLLARAACRVELCPETVSQLRSAIGECRWEAVLRGHEGPVYSASFSPTGKHMLTTSADGTARVWDRDGHQVALLRSGHKDGAWARFSPQGDRILTVGADEVSTWDIDGRQLATLRHPGLTLPWQAEFSPDGTRVVTGSRDGTVRLWSTEGECLAVLKGHSESVITVCFSPSGGSILSSSEDKTARLWDLKGNHVGTLRGHEEAVLCAAFSPDGKRIVTASADRTARVWSLGGEVLAVLSGHKHNVWRASFSPTGDRILTAGWDSTCRLWNAGGNLLAILSHSGTVVHEAAFSRDGVHILTHASDDPVVRVWDSSGKTVATLRGLMGALTTASFSPDGNLIIAGADDGTAQIFGLTKRELAVMRHDRGVTAVSFSPSGETVLTASLDGTARLWDRNGRELTVFRGHKGEVYSAVFSPSGAHVLTGGWEDCTARVWDLEGRELAVLRGHSGSVGAAYYSPAGDQILTISMDKTARLWDEQGKSIAVLAGHAGPVWAAAFSAEGDRIVTAEVSEQAPVARVWNRNGDMLAVLRGHSDGVVSSVDVSASGVVVTTGFEDETARLWDLEGNGLAVLRGHSGKVISAAFSATGDMLATAGYSDQTIRLWTAQGSEAAVMRGHTGPVTDVSIAPAGDLIASASSDGTARLWELDGTLKAILNGHEPDDLVLRVCFSPSGDRLLTGSFLHGTARLWLVHDEDLLELAERRILRDFTPEERRRFAPLLSGSEEQ